MEDVRHQGCLGGVGWHAVVDDEGEPVLVPWCLVCGRALGETEVEGDLQRLQPTPVQVEELLLLQRMILMPIRQVH